MWRAYECKINAQKVCKKTETWEKICSPAGQWAQAQRQSFKNNNINVLEWLLSQTAWRYVAGLGKEAVHSRSSRNLTELEQFCKEERGKLSTHAKLMETYPHRPKAVTAASTKYWLWAAEDCSKQVFCILYLSFIFIILSRSVFTFSSVDRCQTKQHLI